MHAGDKQAVGRLQNAKLSDCMRFDQQEYINDGRGALTRPYRGQRRRRRRASRQSRHGERRAEMVVATEASARDAKHEAEIDAYS